MNRNASRREQRTPEDRQRRHRFGIIRSVVILIGLILLTVWITRQGQGPEVLSLTLAKSLDAQYRPVQPTETFTPDETFFVSAELRGYRADMDVVARWRYEGQIVTETPLATGDTGSGYAGFSLAPQDPPRWPEGSYVVDIMYEDHLLARTAFEVVETQP